MQENEPSEESIFALALAKPSSAERAAFVDGACVGNPTLREKVEDLLRSHEEAGSFLQHPISSATVTFDHDQLSERPGERIGPYRLLQQIGEGGMGVVYMAEQERPVRRKVALKIIKPGMDSTQVVARFEAERQALAVMDHTNIARVFDADTTESGRPYFVMELVHGVPITDYCDANQLTPRERLELFVPVCQAIQHAHQKGIIHRDIKPSNVLVTMYDDKPVPKVIDFGVAKATEQRLTERTLFTQYGALVGTFEYMSPEQAEMNAFGVDTRSDIYSLGVLLYELLTGTTPLEKLRLRQAALGELIRLIKEEEPPRPSVRLSSSGDLPKIAALRKTEPARLSKLVRGEVDWIVMKCLEKDRTRRYETASGLARDVERHLKDESVEACPPSAGYRLRKFARKHKRWLATAAVITALLVISAADGIWLLVRAWRAEARAMAALDRGTLAAHQATAAEQEALKQRDLALAERHEAETARQSLRRSLYAADIQLAEEAWESGSIFRMRELLDGQKPRTGEDDLRGFEWHYLRRLGSTVQVTRLAPDTIQGQISPDGTHYVYIGRIVAPKGPEASSEIELRLLDVATGRQVRRIVPFAGETISDHWMRYPFSRDGKRFLFMARIRDGSGRHDWRAKIFEWETGHEVCTLADLGGAPHTAAFDSPGGRLATVRDRQGGAAGSDLRIWDMSGGKELLAIPLPGRQVVEVLQSVAFSPEGASLVVLTKPARPDASISTAARLASHSSLGGQMDSVGEIKVCDAASGKELLRFATRAGSTGLAYSPDGKRLVEIGGPGKSHLLRDVSSGREILELASAPDAGLTWAMAFSHDGSRVAGSSGDGKLRIWDVSAGEPNGVRAPDHTLEGKTTLMSQVAWSADGGRVSTSGYGGTVLTWQVAAREPRLVVQGSEHIKCVTATVAASSPRFAGGFEDPDGQTVLKVWDEAGKVLFTATDQESGPYGPSRSTRRLDLSRDGTRLAYSAWDSTQGKAREVARLRVWEIATGREVFHRDDARGSFHHTTFSPDDRWLATAQGVLSGPVKEQENWVSIWDLETGKERLHQSVSYLAALAFRPDGGRLAAAVSAAPGRDNKGELRIWDAATGQVVQTQTLTNGYVSNLAYTADGTSLVVAVGAVGDAGVIKVLDADSGRERFSLAGHRNMIWKLAISADGRLLASLASFPMRAPEVKLWDLSGGREMLTLEATGIDLIGSDVLGSSGFGFSPDGLRLFYVPAGNRRDAAVQVWDATPLPDDRAELSSESNAVGAHPPLHSR